MQITFQIDSAQFYQLCLHKTTQGNQKIIKSLGSAMLHRSTHAYPLHTITFQQLANQIIGYLPVGYDG